MASTLARANLSTAFAPHLSLASGYSVEMGNSCRVAGGYGNGNGEPRRTPRFPRLALLPMPGGTPLLLIKCFARWPELHRFASSCPFPILPYSALNFRPRS